MRHLDGRTRRVVLSHAAGSVALSLPWPLLLVLVAERSDDPVVLGLAGSARMLPYVLCSWAAGRLADAWPRDLIVRATLVARGVLFVVGAVAVVSGHVWTAVLACTLAVAVATPAFPALVAAMPGVARERSRRATDLLVTVEVAGFVVGASIGGLLLAPPTRGLVPWVPAALVVVAAVLVAPVRMPRAAYSRSTGRLSAYAALRAAPAARRAIAVMAAVNFVDALLALALLPLALHAWGSDASGYGVAAGVLGFAALAAPLLERMGRTPQHAVRRGLLLVATGVALVVPVTTVVWALVPLAVVGAASVAVEAAATGVLQDELPDEVRATVLGLNDTVVISAALVGSLLAPVAVQTLGGGAVLTAVAVAVWLPRAPARQQGPAVRIPAPRTGDHDSGLGSLRPAQAATRGPAPASPAGG